MPREALEDINLDDYVYNEGYEVPWSRFGESPWSLERPEVGDLMAKIGRMGIPLKEFTGAKPSRGFVTGFNEAFLIDSTERAKLISLNINSEKHIKPCARGSDIKRWALEGKEMWIILPSIEALECDCIKKHLLEFRSRLKARAGIQEWWQFQGKPASYEFFEQPKIIYPDIIWRGEFAITSEPLYLLNTVYFIPSYDMYLLAILNSPILWSFMWRHCVHGKDEALRMFNPSVEPLPIAPPTDEIREQTEPKVQRLIELTKANQQAYREVLDWLKSRFAMEKPGQKLERFATLSEEEFLAELRKRIPRKGKAGDPLGVAGQKEVKQLYGDYGLPIQTRNREILQLEHQISDLVNQAYGLTPEDIDLMWRTAPPRMPIQRPNPSTEGSK